MTRFELYSMLTEAMREANNVKSSTYTADWMHKRIARILADKLAARHQSFDRDRFRRECTEPPTATYCHRQDAFLSTACTDCPLNCTQSPGN